MHRITHLGTRIAPLFGALVMLLVAAAPAGAVATGSDSAGFGVAPLKVEVEAKPGTTTTHQIRITNTDDRPAQFTFTKEDFEGDKVDPAATPVLLGGKFASEISGFDWLSTPDNLTVPAGETKVVNVRVSVPSDATGGHYAALMVTGPARTAGDLVAQSRMGVLFMMNAGGVPPPDIIITEVTQVGPNKTVTKYINKGQTAVKPKPSLVTDPRGTGTTTRTNGTCTTALPGAAGECVVETTVPGTTVGGNGTDAGGIPGVPPKKRIELVTPEGSSATAGMPTEWAGTWSSLLLPLVGIALFVIYFLFLRRRRKEEEEAEDGDFGTYAA